jgi:hypothetical protein
MPIDDNKEKEHVNQTAGDVKLDPPSLCPLCGAHLTRKLFRTGSTEYPGRDMLVCERCGSRR